MDPLSRSEILQVLAHMGIPLPKVTKLPDDVLERRVRDALNASQNRANIPSPLGPSTLPPWPMIKPWDGSMTLEGRSVFETMRLTSVQEMDANARALRAGHQPDAGPLYVNPFMDLRQTMMTIGHTLDDGKRWCVLQDPKCERYAINVRFLSVLEVDNKTPAIILLYRLYTRMDGLEGIKWCQHQYDKYGGRPGVDGVMMITATPLEVKLLLKLLAMNANLLPPDYTPAKGLYEDGYKVSVLLPIAPLTSDALGSLNNDAGCVICGKERTSRCSQCQSVSYCGPDCQKVDWPVHKTTCRSLKGGRWCAIPFRTILPGCENMESQFLNRRTIMHPSRVPGYRAASSAPPPNVHGEKVFLVKMQAGLGPGVPMLIYDRNRSFNEAFFCETDDPATHAAVLEEIRGPRGGYAGLKTYRWAKRTGDFELSLCLDREPMVPIVW